MRAFIALIKGLTYYYFRKYKKAIKCYNKALALNPQLAVAYYNRGRAYLERGEYDQAIADYNNALSIDP